MHYMALHKLNDVWRWEIRAAINDWEHTHGEIPMAGWGSKRGVEIASYRHNPTDPDNLHGGLKPLLDALTHNRLIWDDRTKNAAWVADQIIERKNPRTYIAISL